MKIGSTTYSRPRGCSRCATKRCESGSVVFIFVALLAIMSLWVTANSKALFCLRKETDLLEQRQIERLDAGQTNAPVNLPIPAQPEPK